MKTTNYQTATADRLRHELALSIDRIWDSLEESEKEIVLENEILDSDHAIEIYFGDLSLAEQFNILLNYQKGKCSSASDVSQIVANRYSTKLRKGLKVATCAFFYLCPECNSMDIDADSNYCPECRFDLGSDKRK